MPSDPEQPRRDTDSADGDSAGGQPTRAADGDVVVPVDLYKVVTVFSTLIAVTFVVLGFLFLDAATGAVRRVSLLGWVVGLAVFAACYLGYMSVRSGARTLERLLVGAVLFYLVAAGVPTLVPGVPVLIREALAAASLSDVQFQALFGVAGLALIGVGAGVYILGTRFRTEGMGNPKDDADQRSDNG
ncbi:hypothetical protein ACFPYI_02990 [Halomarina salina]|uniref:DUF7315 domain-containing protein n=1 Tax=Halomarina salina TaxID=1872699 RepID=A0ABD5RI71_9EURY|nr:hypothetical protein [Halomarina salina]